MGRIVFTSDPEKCTQALNYFARRQGGRINKMKSLKLIFFADRYHLRKYGRFVTNDNYFAMTYGPVPSNTKEIAESNDYLQEDAREYSVKYINPINNLELFSINDVDTDVFSDSDIEALDFAWEHFGHLNQFELADISHFYPEWAKYRNSISRGTCFPMGPLDFLNDPDTSVEKCFELDDKSRKIIREQIIEKSAVEALWR